MIDSRTLTPVIARAGAGAVPLWPVSAGAGWLRLHGGMAPDEVGAAVWSFVWHGQADEPSVDALFAPGGLVVADEATGVVVEPGCCCDLFEWRDWLGALAGETVDLGHDPDTWAAEHGDGVRVQVEDGAFIDIECAELGELLRGVQRDLLGFLDAARGWAGVTASEVGGRFVAALDSGLHISAPMGRTPR